MGLTGPALRVLAEGHRAAEAAATARSMAAIRTAVWAEAADFDRAMGELEEGPEDDASWLMGFDGDAAADTADDTDADNHRPGEGDP